MTGILVIGEEKYLPAADTIGNWSFSFIFFSFKTDV
jgi:hypothetical protein